MAIAPFFKKNAIIRNKKKTERIGENRRKKKGGISVVKPNIRTRGGNRP